MERAWSALHVILSRTRDTTNDATVQAGHCVEYAQQAGGRDRSYHSGPLSGIQSAVKPAAPWAEVLRDKCSGRRVCGYVRLDMAEACILRRDLVPSSGLPRAQICHQSSGSASSASSMTRATTRRHHRWKRVSSHGCLRSYECADECAAQNTLHTAHLGAKCAAMTSPTSTSAKPAPRPTPDHDHRRTSAPRRP